MPFSSCSPSLRSAVSVYPAAALAVLLCGPAGRGGENGRSAPVLAQWPPAGESLSSNPGSVGPLSGVPEYEPNSCVVTFGPQVEGEVSGELFLLSLIRNDSNGTCGAFSIVAFS